jgi:AcrR family transcriptional regulator
VGTSAVLDRSQRAELAKAARREEILEAARRVFAARGFRGTTIADVAEEAGTALGTIYLYFASKEAIFGALHQRFIEIITTASTRPSAATSLDRVVRERVAEVFDACSENRDLVRLVVLNADPESEVARRIRQADNARMRPLEEALANGIEARAVRPGDPAIMSRLIQGSVSIAVYQAFVLEDGRHTDQYRDGCADMIVAYLSPGAEGT